MLGADTPGEAYTRSGLVESSRLRAAPTVYPTEGGDEQSDKHYASVMTRAAAAQTRSSLRYRGERSYAVPASKRLHKAIILLKTHAGLLTSAGEVFLASALNEAVQRRAPLTNLTCNQPTRHVCKGQTSRVTHLSKGRRAAGRDPSQRAQQSDSYRRPAGWVPKRAKLDEQRDDKRLTEECGIGLAQSKDRPDWEARSQAVRRSTSVARATP